MRRKQEYCEKKHLAHRKAEIGFMYDPNIILQVSIPHAFEMFDFSIKASTVDDVLWTHIYDSDEMEPQRHFKIHIVHPDITKTEMIS